MTTKTYPLASVTVNNTTIPQVTYKGQPVLTMKAIAALHDVSLSNIKSNHANNRRYFKEGVDFFKLTAAEAKMAGFPHPSECQSEFATKSLFTYGGPGIVLFTKSGYLKLTKSLTDAKAWAVHQTLSDSYFQLEEIKTVLKETGGVYVAPEAVDDDNTLLFAKALKAADIMLAKRDAQIAEMHYLKFWDIVPTSGHKLWVQGHGCFARFK